MIPYRLLTLAVAFSLLLNASPAAAQSATPVASLGAGPAALDLAAMLPTPNDLGAPGYLINRGLSETMEEAAESSARIEQTDVATQVSIYQHEGFRGQAQADYIVPSASGDGTAERLVEVQVMEYIDPMHAMNAFDERLQLPKSLGYVTPLALGDVAALSRTPNNSGYQMLEAVFLSGPLLADIQISDRNTTPVDQSRAAALGAIFAARIAQVREHGGPGLGAMTLRVPYGGATKVDEDNYVVLAGRAFRASIDSDAEFAKRLRETNEITDSYAFIAELGSAALLITGVKQYANERRAERGFQDQVTSANTSTSSGMTAKTVAAAPAFGDESTMVHVTGAPSGEAPLDGYAVLIRSGALVALVIVLSIDNLPLVTAESLARAQTACLQAGACSRTSLATASVIASQLDAG